MLVDLDSLTTLIGQCAGDPGFIRVAHTDCGEFVFLHVASEQETPAPFAVYRNGREVHRGFGTWKECVDSSDIVYEKIQAKSHVPH